MDARTNFDLHNKITFLNLNNINNNTSRISRISRRSRTTRVINPPNNRTRKQNTKDIKLFIKNFKDLIKLYIEGEGDTNQNLNCKNLLHVDSFKIILPPNSRRGEQQDSNEIFLKMFYYLNRFIEKKLKPQPVNINKNNDFNNSDNTKLYNKIKLYINNNNNNNNDINPLYYLFGMFEKNKLKKIHKTNTLLNYENFKYQLTYVDTTIKIDDTKIKYDNIKELLNYNRLLLPENLPLSNNNSHIYNSQERTNYNNIYFGKYAILCLSILTFENVSGKTKLNKTKLTFDKLTDNLNDNYEFFGSIFHHGGSGGGHYTSLVRNGNIYYNYDDTVIKSIDSNTKDINNEYDSYNPTMLIYKRMSDIVLDREMNDNVINFFKNNQDSIDKIKSEIDKQRRGSENIGNTCYFNALISILLNIPEFVHLILNNPIFNS